jgi:hypothetical protein
MNKITFEINKTPFVITFNNTAFLSAAFCIFTYCFYTIYSINTMHYKINLMISQTSFIKKYIYDKLSSTTNYDENFCKKLENGLTKHYNLKKVEVKFVSNNSETKTEPDTKTKTKTEPDPKPDPDTKTKTEPEKEPVTELDPKPDPDTEIDIETDYETEKCKKNTLIVKFTTCDNTSYKLVLGV